MRLHLVDATYELFRAFYAPRPPVLADDGRDLTATWGLVENLLAILRDEGATHLGAATDRVIESFRNDLYAGYKTGVGVDPRLLAQFPIAEAAIEALGIRLWPMVAFEADDAIAAAVARWADDPGVDQVVICSPDKDMAQCVRDERVVMFDRRRRLVYDEAGVIAKWGVRPGSIPDLLALVGDAADGYPGLPGWGAKSAAAVLLRYGSLETIPAQASDWDIAGPRRRLAGGDAPRATRRGLPVPHARPAADRRAAAGDVGRRAALAWDAACPLAGILRRDRSGSVALAATPLARGRLTGGRRADRVGRVAAGQDGARTSSSSRGVVGRRRGDDAERARPAASRTTVRRRCR